MIADEPRTPTQQRATSPKPAKAPWRDPPRKAPQFTPDTTWTTDKIRNVVTEHEEGYFWRSSLLAEWMMRDGRLATVMETRIKGMMGLPFVVEPPSASPRLRERKIAEATQTLMPQIMPDAVTAEVLETLVKHGFCLCQVLWTDNPGGLVRWVPRLKVWSTQYVYYDQTAEGWFICKNDGIERIQPGDGQWVLFSYRDAMPWMAGVVRQLGIPVLLRSYSWSDWSSFNETLGQSFLKAFIPAWANKTTDDDNGSPSKETYMTQVKSIGREFRYLFCEVDANGDKYDAEYVSPEGKGAESFERAQGNASTEITTRVLGQNLTTEVSGTGSYAATKGHEEVRQDYKESDAEFIATDLREQLLKPFVMYNWGDPDLAAWAYYDPTPPADQKTRAETLKSFSESVDKLQAGLAGSGKRVNVVALYERFEIPLEDGEKEAPEAPKAAIDPAEERALRNVVPWRRRAMTQTPKRRIHPQEAA